MRGDLFLRAAIIRNSARRNLISNPERLQVIVSAIEAYRKACKDIKQVFRVDYSDVDVDYSNIIPDQYDIIERFVLGENA